MFSGEIVAPISDVTLTASFVIATMAFSSQTFSYSFAYCAVIMAYSNGRIFVQGSGLRLSNLLGSTINTDVINEVTQTSRWGIPTNTVITKFDGFCSYPDAKIYALTSTGKV